MSAGRCGTKCVQLPPQRLNRRGVDPERHVLTKPTALFSDFPWCHGIKAESQHVQFACGRVCVVPISSSFVRRSFIFASCSAVSPEAAALATFLFSAAAAITARRSAAVIGPAGVVVGALSSEAACGASAAGADSGGASFGATMTFDDPDEVFRMGGAACADLEEAQPMAAVTANSTLFLAAAVKAGQSTRRHTTLAPNH